MFVITAPSGCGKGTLRQALLSEQPDIKFCPSITTRTPRPGEVEGVDYVFVSKDEFMDRKRRQELAEWAEVYGNYYGTPRVDIEKELEQGSVVLLEKDVQGARTLRRVYPEGIFIFILPPSFEELERRIKTRGTENEMQQRIRLDSARREIADLGDFDYVIINEDLERAKNRLIAITLGERTRLGISACEVKRRSINVKPCVKGFGQKYRVQVYSGACSGKTCKTGSDRARRRSSCSRKTGHNCH